MKKIVDAALVAALLMLAVPDMPQASQSTTPPVPVSQVAHHGDRPC